MTTATDSDRPTLAALRDGPPTITVEEAGQVLGFSRASAYAAARRGELPTLRIGRRLLVPVPALLRMLETADTPA